MNLDDSPYQTALSSPIQVNSTPYDIDDAFSDSDEPPSSFSLSHLAIREELEKSIETTWTDARNEAAHNGFFATKDTSVSTLDISGSVHSASGSPEPHQPQSSEEDDLSAHFSPISLLGPSVSLSEACHEDGHEDDVPMPEVPSEEHPQPSLETDGSASHPNVIIDLSKPPSDRVSLTSDGVQKNAANRHASSPSPIPPTPPTSRSLPETSPQTPLAGSSSTSLNNPTSQSAQPNTGRTLTISPAPESQSPALVASESAPAAPLRHRPTRSVGPSMFEKVRSKTRPSFLPPKSRQEDDKHMADWQSMMKQSRIAAEKRRKALQGRRLAREKRIEESLHIWEREIVPDWRVVYKNPTLRRLWWNGIPTKLRASMWEQAVGNPLALSKDTHRTCLARAKHALSSGTFPENTLSLIESDIASTLPALHIFHHETGPLYQDLKDMLCAWVIARSDEGLEYIFGASKVAAMFLITMPAPQGFVVMRNLLERHCMRSFFGGEGAKDDVEAYYRIFDTLLADGMPKIYFNFKQHQISPAAYLPDWLVPLFLDHLPFEACARVWDVLLLEGDSFLYRAALGILAVLESRLFFPDRKELLELLKGENKAALDIARREGQSLDGGKYEIYGVDEETLWERIDSMEDWWKESTWTRLIQRELPDL